MGCNMRCVCSWAGMELVIIMVHHSRYEENVLSNLEHVFIRIAIRYSFFVVTQPHGCFRLIWKYETLFFCNTRIGCPSFDTNHKFTST